MCEMKPEFDNGRGKPKKINLSKRFLLSLISLFITFVLAFLGLELALYLKNPSEYSKRKSLHGQELKIFNEGIGTCFDDDDVLPFRMNPGTYSLGNGKKLTINSLGYRGREFNAKKERGIIRILFLGDSFTYGYGVDDEDTIPRLTEKILSERFDNIEVINAGFHGSSQQQYDLFLRKKGYDLEPDIIVLTILADNDVTDDFYFNNVLEYGEDGLPSRITDGLRSYGGVRYYTTLPVWLYKLPLLEHSAAWHFLMKRIHYSIKGTPPSFTDEARKSFFDESIFRLINTSKAKGSDLRIWVVIGGHVFLEGGRDHKDYAYIRNCFERNSIPYLDIGKDILKHEKEKILFHYKNGEMDNHLNERGNYIAARMGAEDLVPVIEKLQ